MLSEQFHPKADKGHSNKVIVKPDITDAVPNRGLPVAALDSVDVTDRVASRPHIHPARLRRH